MTQTDSNYLVLGGLNLNSDELGYYFDLLDEPYNIVEQRIKVISKRESEGAYKLDKEGKTIVDPATGELKKWEDSYYVTFFPFEGGSSHSIRVSKEQFEYLKEGRSYIARGKIEFKVIEGSYNSFLNFRFKEFLPLKPFFAKEAKRLAQKDKDMIEAEEAQLEKEKSKGKSKTQSNE